MRRTLSLQQVVWAVSTADRNVALSKDSKVALNGYELLFTGASGLEAKATPVEYRAGNSKVFKL